MSIFIAVSKFVDWILLVFFGIFTEVFDFIEPIRLFHFWFLVSLLSYQLFGSKFSPTVSWFFVALLKYLLFGSKFSSTVSWFFVVLLLASLLFDSQVNPTIFEFMYLHFRFDSLVSHFVHSFTFIVLGVYLMFSF